MHNIYMKLSKVGHDDHGHVYTPYLNVTVKLTRRTITELVKGTDRLLWLHKADYHGNNVVLSWCDLQVCTGVILVYCYLQTPVCTNTGRRTVQVGM